MALPPIPDPDPDDWVVRLVAVVLYAVFIGIAAIGLYALLW